MYGLLCMQVKTDETPVELEVRTLVALGRNGEWERRGCFQEGCLCSGRGSNADSTGVLAL